MKMVCRWKKEVAAGIAMTLLSFVPNVAMAAGIPAKHAAKNKIIIFVWDGLRPDSISEADTPNLARLRAEGVTFTDNHSTYPTFTMINAASIASGGLPGTTGFFGNTVWQPGAKVKTITGEPLDSRQPVFTGDYAVLQSLNAYYRNQLLLVASLFETAQAAGLKTAAIGKSGPAFIQDYKKGGIILDENTVFPLSFAKELQAASIPLPKNTVFAHRSGALQLAPGNGNPTESEPIRRMADGATSDPTGAGQALYNRANAYMMDVYLNFILPRKNPDLAMIWFRNPDVTNHAYGVGGANHRAALTAQDNLLGLLREKLKQLGQDGKTNIIVVSDHGHSSVSGPTTTFPLRAIDQGAVGGIAATGYSVSGDVRTADLLTRAGFLAYDGKGCLYNPIMMGIKRDGSTVYPISEDSQGTICGAVGKKYVTGNFMVPQEFPPGSHPLVIAANGGSEYIYVPDRDRDTVGKVIRFLQSREEYGAVFVDTRYGAVPGTFSLQSVGLENTAGRNPDIVVSLNYDENEVIQGYKGTQFSSATNRNRGSHGSFSPVDVRNTLIIQGPDFKSGFQDALPTGNIDVAPTVAHLLGLTLRSAREGRVLLEALAKTGETNVGNDQAASAVRVDVLRSEQPATGLVMRLATDPDGNDIDSTKNSYAVELHMKRLRQQGRDHVYFDQATAIRQ
ncbi:alkaline phosphatase family protein [Accumulibacter sp.]|uniref:alkaline phosphatase family protein n=1 Tax=Accumulibacter sp. TaxID=2053492 RepID=UPI0035B324C5